jgi:hypothetical protein
VFIKMGDGKGVCRLEQASRQRNKKIHMTLLEVNLKQSGGEPCIYNNTDSSFFLLLFMLTIFCSYQTTGWIRRN